MAFRVNYRGAVIETDTAPEVQRLLTILATPIPARLLGAGETVVEDVTPRRRRKGAHGGGVRKNKPSTAAAPTAPVSPQKSVHASRLAALDDQVLDAIRAGVSKSSELLTRVDATAFILRQTLKRLQDRGVVRAEGVTNDRRYLVADSRRPAKEGLR